MRESPPVQAFAMTAHGAGRYGVVSPGIACVGHREPTLGSPFFQSSCHRGTASE